MKLMQKFILSSILVFCLLFSLSAVNSATFTHENTTQQIQDFIDDSSSIDKKLVFDGEFNNLSTLNINRELKISGKNNAKIIRNSASSSDVLFNIYVPNVVIENLVIRGYATAINSNTGNIIIQNNQIETTKSAIIIESTNEINNTIIKDNKILVKAVSDSGMLYAIYLSSSSDIGENFIVDNIIEFENSRGTAIYLYSDTKFRNNNISKNNIKLYNVYNNRGIDIFSDVISYNDISNNNINLENGNFIGIKLFAMSNLMNNIISGNKITGKRIDSSKGIDLKSVSNMIYNNISDNTLKFVGNDNLALQLESNLDIMFNTIIKNIININGTAPSERSGNQGISLYSDYNMAKNNISDNIINTTNNNAKAIALKSSEGKIHDNAISGNKIKTNGLNSHGIELISDGDSIFNNVFTMNNIETFGVWSYGIFLSTYPKKTIKIELYNNLFKNNFIKTMSVSSVGIYIYGNWNATGDVRDNKFYNNTVITNGEISPGIYLSSCDGSVKNNIISDNKISTNNESSYGIQLYSDYKLVANNKISNNEIKTNGSNSHGLYLQSFTGNLTNNNINNNNIKTYNIQSSGIHFQNEVFGSILNNVVNNNNIHTFNDYSHAICMDTFEGNIKNNLISKNYINTRGIDAFGVSIDYKKSSIENNSILSNNILVNSNGIQLTGKTINDLTIAYNRILVNGSFIVLDTLGNNNHAYANWLGNNTPNPKKIINIVMDSYYVMNIETIKYNSQYWHVNYTLYLNGTKNAAEWERLPYFITTFTNHNGDELFSILAKKSRMVKVPISKLDDKMLVNATTDYQSVFLTIPKPIPPIPDPDKNDTNKTNKSNDNPLANASMKKTGIPIFVVLLVLLSSLGLVYRKK